MSNYVNFRLETLKVRGPRKHKITNSYGVYDAYKWLRKNKWELVGQHLTEHLFYTIIRTLNSVMADMFILDGKINFPEFLGEVILLKKSNSAVLRNNQLRVTYPVNWEATLQLWFEDKEARENKTLVRHTNKYKTCYYYNKMKAKYQNKVFVSFHLNREIKKQSLNNLFGGSIDAFLKYGE